MDDLVEHMSNVQLVAVDVRIATERLLEMMSV